MVFNAQKSEMEYKMLASQFEQQQNIEKLYSDLKPFKAVIVSAHSVLTWEKNYYPVLVFGGISVTYFLLKYMDLSVLTMMSLLALVINILDYSLPKISSWLLRDAIGDGKHEAKFKMVCGQMYMIKQMFAPWYQYLFKERIIMIILVLMALAWIGANVNNLLLMYLATLLIAMCAGLHGKNVVQIIKRKIDHQLAIIYAIISQTHLQNILNPEIPRLGFFISFYTLLIDTLPLLGSKDAKIFSKETVAILHHLEMKRTLSEYISRPPLNNNT